MQECFLSTLKPDSGFDPERTSIRTYLFGAVRNQWLKRLRSQRLSIAHTPDDSRTPETAMQDLEVADAVARHVTIRPTKES